VQAKKENGGLKIRQELDEQQLIELETSKWLY